MVEKLNGTTGIIDIPERTTPIVAYIINFLIPCHWYRFSILMYTIADGPEGINITVKMPTEGRQTCASCFLQGNIFLLSPQLVILSQDQFIQKRNVEMKNVASGSNQCGWSVGVVAGYGQ